MILNLASDKPFVYANDKFIFFDRKNLETQLVIYLKENLKNKIFVITGPGYFSSTRVGVEMINILSAFNFIKEVYFLNKLELFSQIIDKIYLFSGNKNKFIKLENKNYTIVFKKDIKENIKQEELFELEGKNFLYYKNINWENINWNKLEDDKLLKPYYIFAPIVS